MIMIIIINIVLVSTKLKKMRKNNEVIKIALVKFRCYFVEIMELIQYWCGLARFAP